MATEKKYLDLTGLGLYNTKIKEWVSENFNKYDDSELAGRVSNLEILTNDYDTVKSNAANGQTAYTALAAFLGNVTANAAPTLAQIDNVFKTITINGKRLISDSYANNDVVLTGADIAVSGTDTTVLSTKISNMDTTIAGKADKATTLAGYGIIDAYTTTQVDSAIAGVKVTVNGDEDNTYVNVGASVNDVGRAITLTVDESKLSTKISNMDTTIAGKADKATTLAGYGITDAYTTTQVDSAIAGVKSEILGGDITQALEDYDTIKEIAEWITSDESGAAALAGKVSDLETSVSNLDTNKADKATTLAGYGITDAYTTTQVDSAIADVKVTVNGDEDNTYVNVGASVDDIGRTITLTVDDSALSNKITAIESGKTSMSVGSDGVVFSQGSGDTGITVSPITQTEIESLFA